MNTWKSLAAVTVLSASLLSCTTYRGVNDMIPADGSVAADEVATLVVAYPLKPNSLNGEPVNEVGTLTTTFYLAPGTYELESHMDTSTHWGDRVLVITYQDPYTGLAQASQRVATQSSGIMSDTIELQPGWIHFFRIIMKGSSQFWTGITAGDNPLTLPDEKVIRFDPLESTISVETNGSLVNYSMNSKLIFFSPDGKHLSFFTNEKNDWYAVVDGVRKGPFYGIHTVPKVWSLDSKTFAYGVLVRKDSKGSDNYIVIDHIVDDERIGPFNYIEPDVPMFFDFENRIVCSVKRGDQWLLLRGDEEQPMENREAAEEAVWAEWKRYNDELQSIGYRKNK